MCRYRARGALAMERFEEAEDGRIAYCMIALECRGP
nr:hypothetical protein [Archangium sp. Cb G35]